MRKFTIYQIEKRAYESMEVSEDDVSESIGLIVIPLVLEFNFKEEFDKLVDIWYDEIRADISGIEIISLFASSYFFMYNNFMNYLSLER